MKIKIHEQALIDRSVLLGEDVIIWAWSHVRENAEIGDNVIIGERVYIGSRVTIGKKSKIQNGAQIYDPASIEEGVFIGPGVILTNDKYPRAIGVNGEPKLANDWMKVGVKVCRGASIGAGAICVAPVQIGEWAFVTAGSVVVKDVPNFALVAGAPANQIGWVGKSGHRLVSGPNRSYICPQTNEIYILNESGLLTEK
jgi:acetyltransferase-like isoleucine patch superfamily enzyme